MISLESRVIAVTGILRWWVWQNWTGDTNGVTSWQQGGISLVDRQGCIV